jgi:hypothetical protein
MPALLLHLAAVERLNADSRALPPALARALDEDLEYARLGAVLLDLPRFDGVAGALREPLHPAGRPTRYAQLFHLRAPVAFGLKVAELVSLGALVGAEAGHAFVSGYFTHLVLDRRLQPLEERLAATHKLPGETPWEARRRVEWTQALLYLKDVHGMDLVGTSALLPRFQVSKRGGIPFGGMGGGLYEIVRLASREVLGEAPTKREVDGWVRGLYVYGRVLGSPLGRARALPAWSNLSSLELYRSSELDVAKEIDAALADARAVLTRVSEYMARRSFTRRARARFLEDVPEASLQPSAA